MNSENSEKSESADTIRQEFKNLGKNIRDIFGNAWESQEKQNIQDDIKNGLDDFGESIKKLTEDLHIQDLTQKVVDGVGGIGDRVRSGEIEDKAKNDILQSLKKMNKSLEKAASKFSPTEKDENEMEMEVETSVE